MIQCGGGAGFAREALARIRHIEITREHLDRHHATKDGIVRHIHGPHAAATEPPLNLVSADLGAWLEHALSEDQPLLCCEPSTIRPTSLELGSKTVAPGEPSGHPDRVGAFRGKS